jgi:hypothetical protein
MRRAAGLGARVAVRPLGAAVALGGTARRRARSALSDAIGQAALASLDGLMAWEFTDRAVSTALRGPLVDAVARDLTRFTVLERVAGPAFTEGVIEQVAVRVLDSAELEQLVSRALESPGMERLLTGTMESPATERLVTRVIESRLLEQTFTRLLESEELWVLVEEIARSPAVTEAITQQSLGFADQVAAGVRDSSSGADAWLERAARRVRRRHQSGGGPVGGAADAPA